MAGELRRRARVSCGFRELLEPPSRRESGLAFFAGSEEHAEFDARPAAHDGAQQARVDAVVDAAEAYSVEGHGSERVGALRSLRCVRCTAFDCYSAALRMRLQGCVDVVLGTLDHNAHNRLRRLVLCFWLSNDR